MAEYKYKSDSLGFYENNVEEYLRKTTSPYESIIRDIEFDILSDIFKKLGLDKCKVLDIACGYGRHAEFYTKLGCEYTGFDIDKSAIKLALDSGLNVHLWSEHLKCDPDFVNNEQFNVFHSFRFLLNNKTAFISTTKRISPWLGDSGIFIFNVHLNNNSLTGLMLRLKNFLLPNRDNSINTISYNEVRSLMNELGFEIVDRYDYMLLPRTRLLKLFPVKIYRAIERMIVRFFHPKRFGTNFILCAKRKL